MVAVAGAVVVTLAASDATDAVVGHYVMMRPTVPWIIAIATSGAWLHDAMARTRAVAVV